MTRIEEERIDEMLADAISERDRPIIGDGSLYDFHPSELVNALTELKELRAQGGVGVTDEMVERACEAYVAARYDGGVVWPEHFSRDEVRDGRYNMSKALTAALSEESKP